MQYSCRLCCALALLAVLATSTATFAKPSDPPGALQAPAIEASPAAAQPFAESREPQPVLIVRVTTLIENEGKPTLDVEDLERYFVQQLIARNLANVVPSRTARIPNPPAPNMDLVEVSVDAMHPAQRTAQNEQNKLYYDQDVFDVELSLVVKHLQSGRVVGTTGERHEHWFTRYSEDDRLVEKRAAIFKAADNLADRFGVGHRQVWRGPSAKPSTRRPGKIHRASDFSNWLTTLGAGFAGGVLLLGSSNTRGRSVRLLASAIFTRHPDPTLLSPGPRTRRDRNGALAIHRWIL